MPVLDARALKADPDGLAFLRDVLRPAGTGAEKAALPAREPARPRRTSVQTVSASTLPLEPPQAP